METPINNLIKTAQNPTADFGNLPQQQSPDSQQEEVGTPIKRLIRGDPNTLPQSATDKTPIPSPDQIQQMRMQQEQEQELQSGSLQQPVNVQAPDGQGQGNTLAERSGKFLNKKEYFGLGLENQDYLSMILVFVFVLVFSNGILWGNLKGVAPILTNPMGGASLLGSVLVGIISAVIFFLIRFFTNK